MAIKQKEKNEKRTGLWHGVKNETKQGIWAVTFFVLAAIFTLASLSKAGVVGDKIYYILSVLLGIGYFLIPLFFFLLSVSFLKAEEREFNKLKVTGGIFFFISGLGLIDLVSKTYWIAQGGKIGWLISTPLLKLFGFYASTIILVAVLIISCLVLFETKLTVESILFWRKWKKTEKEGVENKMDMKKLRVTKGEDNSEEETEDVERVEKAKRQVRAVVVRKSEEEEEFKMTPRAVGNTQYTPPPLSLLENDKGKPGVGDIKANANIIKRTLQNFGIDVEMDEVSIGPSITRYAFKPAEGMKLSRIVGLQNDLALALAAHPLRIEAPIPGKSLVGIEIPNTVKSIVGLASLIGTEEFQKSEKPLMITLGKGISGKSHYANLAKMPHVLVAGSTGSGKSVTIHTIITSLLYRNSPENLKFIMIDPKRVELTLYNKIPHLLTPVITEAKKTILALKWATKEMDRRYDILEAEACKDIDSYHKNILSPELKKIEELKKKGQYDPEKHTAPELMPYIIVVIDELADIMMSYPRELESAIVRLAQMSRAVGIHLILSTQRPSVNVITGLIKANVPARIALQVVSQVDSRTILDTSGAEKLLGAGDMLYLGGEMSKPVRIQSAFISEAEVKGVVKYLVNAYRDELIGGELNLTPESVGGENSDALGSMLEAGEMGEDDDMYEQAKDEVIKAGKASTSYIQRKLRLGYARAARIMDMLEQRGIIGPGDGAKPRDVLVGSAAEAEENKLKEQIAEAGVEHKDGDYL
ncbi:MAG: DNA translocase FtsK 4TM domain-containing protein [Candidatus Paceibacterota bacterium]|jgi:S-DNA-T family DNA segregation ATPase FtsK/SpoIIIE